MATRTDVANVVSGTCTCSKQQCEYAVTARDALHTLRHLGCQQVIDGSLAAKKFHSTLISTLNSMSSCNFNSGKTKSFVCPLHRKPIR
jgi:hypothetical protein